jgi:hypothetical protein
MPSSGVDMGGWDVVYASSVAKLNSVLEASSSQLLPTFSYDNPSQQLAFSGTFGPWSIQPGGTANRINLQVPIATGQITSPALADTVSLDGVQPVLNLALTLIEGTGGGSQDMRFDLVTNSSTPSDDAGVVYLANVDESGKLAQRDPTGTAAAMMRDWFGELFVANQSKISFVFATVFTDPDGAPYLKPTATAVSYFESIDGSVQAIGIKTITQSPWGPNGLTTAFDPNLLASGYDMFYGLSQAVFMKNLLLPAMAKALKVSPQALRFNGPTNPSQQDNCSITNAGTISLPSVEPAGITYHPKMTHFKVVISGNQIQTSAAGNFDITGLHDAYVTFDNLSVVSELTFDPATKSIGFEVVRKTSPSTDSHIPWYEKTITWVVPAIGLVINLVMDIVVDTIESAVESSVTGTGSLGNNAIALQTAVWTGLEQFAVSQASLSPGLVIRGTSA